MFGIQQIWNLGFVRLLAASGIECFQEATVAAMAVATAPGWVAGLKDEETKASVAALQKYLRETAPPNDYGSVVLLWASTRMKDLLSAQRRSELVELLWHHQRKDGGWSLRTFPHLRNGGGVIALPNYGLSRNSKTRWRWS